MFDRFIPMGILHSLCSRNALLGCAEQACIPSTGGGQANPPSFHLPLLPTSRGLEELLLPWIQERGILSRQTVITQVGTQPGHCEEHSSSFSTRCQGGVNGLQSAPPSKWGTHFRQSREAHTAIPTCPTHTSAQSIKAELRNKFSK